MDQAQLNWITNFIWGIADDTLRDAAAKLPEEVAFPSDSSDPSDESDLSEETTLEDES